MSEGLVYFKDGELVAQNNIASVYKMNKQLFLEIGPGHTLWALESELTDYMAQLVDYPRGDCLEIGLGLGVASRYLLTFPKVKSLTTVEVNPDVIEVHKKIKEEDRNLSLGEYNGDKHTILNADGISYCFMTKKRYDFIFIDCYDRIDEDTLPFIADMAYACSKVLKPNGKLVGWLDNHTPEEDYVKFQKIIELNNVT